MQVKTNGWNGTVKTITVEPIKVSLYGKLAVTPSVDQTTGGKPIKGYAITHIPTGYALQRGIRNKKDAISVMLQIEKLDWNFRSPRSRKLAKLRDTVVPILKALRTYYD